MSKLPTTTLGCELGTSKHGKEKIDIRCLYVSARKEVGVPSIGAGPESLELFVRVLRESRWGWWAKGEVSFPEIRGERGVIVFRVGLCRVGARSSMVHHGSLDN